MNWCREYVQKLLQKFPLVNFPLGSMQIRKHRWWLIRKAMSLSQSHTNCLWRQNDISTVRNQTDKGSLSFGGAHMTSHCVFNGFVQGYYCNANCCNILLESFVSLYLLSRSWRPPENSQHSFLLLLQSCCFFKFWYRNNNETDVFVSMCRPKTRTERTLALLLTSRASVLPYSWGSADRSSWIKMLFDKNVICLWATVQIMTTIVLERSLV